MTTDTLVTARINGNVFTHTVATNELAEKLEITEFNKPVIFTGQEGYDLIHKALKDHMVKYPANRFIRWMLTEMELAYHNFIELKKLVYLNPDYVSKLEVEYVVTLVN